MEEDLDKIANGNKIWHELCDKCDKEIQILSKDLKSSQAKETIKIDDRHTYIIGKYGPVIKCVGEESKTANSKTSKTSKISKDKMRNKGDNITFLPVKKDIDMIKLQNGEYKLEELIEEKMETTSETGKLLGTHNEEQVYLKTGKFGLFVQWGENTKALKGLRIKEPDITIDNILPYLINTNIQKINENISIRKGKYGDYIFYQTLTMKKPQFYKLNGFPCDYKTSSNRMILDWVDEKYNIS
jgi:DNA topoisomerase-1